MNLEQLIHAELLRADLQSVNSHFTSIGVDDALGLLHLKTAFVALANVTDFEPQIRPTYTNHPDPSAIFKDIKKQLEFAKYLRNKAIAHIHPALIAKAIEWQPVLRHVPGRVQKPGGAFALNLWLLETAINTYLDADGNHRVFDGETDLMYPPDSTRFLAYLQTTIRGAISYLTCLLDYWTPRVAALAAEPFDLELALKAGETDFKFLAQ